MAYIPVAQRKPVKSAFPLVYKNEAAYLEAQSQAVRNTPSSINLGTSQTTPSTRRPTDVNAIIGAGQGADALSGIIASIPSRAVAPLIGAKQPKIETFSEQASSVFGQNLGKAGTALGFAAGVIGDPLNLITGGGAGATKLAGLLSKADNVGQTTKLLREAGFADDVIEMRAGLFASEKNATKIEQILKSDVELMKTTKRSYVPVAERTQSKPIAQLAESIQQSYPNLQYSRVYDIAEQADILSRKATPAQVNEFIKSELSNIPKGSLPAVGESRVPRATASDVSATYDASKITPSNNIVAPSLPRSGLDTNASPSLTRTLEPGGASKSIRYTEPSQLYSLDDSFIPTDYTKVSRLAQVNKSAFTDDIVRATGLEPDVRIKKQDSFEGKIERYLISGKDPNTIADNLAGRVVVSEPDIYTNLEKVRSNFDVVEVSDFFKIPTGWGYKGINVKVRLPNGQLAEIQIHTPESLSAATDIHKLYEKWRNLDLSKLSNTQIDQLKQDVALSQSIARDAELAEKAKRLGLPELPKISTPPSTQKILGQQPLRVTRTAQEKTLLKEKIKQQATGAKAGFESGETYGAQRGFREGLSVAGKTISKQETQIKRAAVLAEKKDSLITILKNTAQSGERVKDLVVQYAKDALSTANRGKALTLIRDAKDAKGLTKAFARINRWAEEEIKVGIKADVLKLQKQIMESPSVAIDYKARVKELMGDFELKGHREDTLKRLKATQEFLQSEAAKGHDIELPRRILKALDILNRTPFEEITINQLKGLQAEMELLEDLGRTKFRTTEAVWEIQKGKILGEVEAQGAKPIQNIELLKPEIGERMTITMKFKNFIWRAVNQAARIDKAIAPMDTIFDLLDGGKGTYAGANFRFFKGQIDAGYGRYNSRKWALGEPIKDLAEKYKLDNTNFERMGIVAAREQDGGMEKLVATGFTEAQVNAVKLTAQEQELLNLMRSTMDSQFPEIQDVMRRVYNQPVQKVKNYFSFMTDWKAMDESEVFQRFGSQLPEQYGAPRKNVEAGFTKSRVGGDQKIKINAMEIFDHHIDNTSYLLETGEVAKMLGEVAASPQYAELVGDVGQLMVREWLDVIARKGGAAGASQIAVLDTLRRNVGAGILGLKLSTVAIQPTALIDGAGFIGAGYATRGATHIATDSAWRKFVFSMPEIKDRVGGEFALRELTEDNWLQNAQRKGFIPMQTVDQYTAGSIAAGAYERKMIELGEAIDLTKPYNEEALAYAQLAVRRTQSSGAFKDVPLAVSRGALTGNRSLDRAILQFQNFLLTRWSRVRHDAFRAGVNTRDPKKAIPVFTAIVMAAIAGSGIRLGVNKIQDFITGREDEDTATEDLKRGFIYEMTGNVPFLGTAISMAMYDGEMFPILDAPKGVISGLNRVITSESEGAKLRGLTEFAGSTGALFGIPGSLQAETLVRGSLQDEKKSVGPGLPALPELPKLPTLPKLPSI